MRYVLVLLFATCAISALAQGLMPAANFASSVAATQVNQQLINDLYFQLQLAQKQLATVQGAQAQLQKDLSAAQAKCPCAMTGDVIKVLRAKLLRLLSAPEPQQAYLLLLT